MATQFEEESGGLQVLGLRTDELEVRCAPDAGGRIFSLLSRRTGREWLWRQASKELFIPRDPRDFSSGTFAGLDECCPSVGACTWSDGRMIHDHGNMWALPWKIEQWGEGTIDLSVRMEDLGLEFKRNLSVRAGKLRFEYTLQNFGDVASPAMWSMHPLFSLYPGDRLDLLPAYTGLVVESGSHRKVSDSSQERMASEGGDPRRSIQYPQIEPGVNLDRLELADLETGYLKCFGANAYKETPRVVLKNPASSDVLEVSWDHEHAPYLGLWLTRGGYRGWHHVAIEPCTAPYDRVVDALSTNSQPSGLAILAPGASRRWWVEWAVSSSA